MTSVFIKVLNMSIAASWLALAVILLRFFLKKSPRWIACLLWGIVALRLVMPFTFESAISLIPSSEVIPLDVAVSETPAIYSGIPAVNSSVNPLFTQYFSTGENLIERILFYATMVWLIGMAIMLLYSAVSYFKLRRQVRASLLYRDNIYYCDNLDSPFLLGTFRPRIYIPSDMNGERLQFVLSHENAHIRRRDHWWKPLGFLLLSIYWFNPLLWVAYILLCRDVEQACDEKVIAGLDASGKIGYSEALVACSVHRRTVMACPVAFGEVGVKARIKGVLNYKKPAFWIVLTSGVLCVITAMCFLTNPKPCDHDYREQLTTAPTCTETGVMTQVCTHCQHSYTKRVDLLEHTYDAGVVTQQPSCTHQGNRVLSCIYCGDQQAQIMKMTDHIAGGPMIIHAPDCTHTGERIANCVYCHHDFVAQVYPTNDDHDLKETVLKAATCTAPGEGVFTCSRCGYSESCAYEQLGHNYVGSVVKKATCRQIGVMGYTCSECGDSYQTTTGYGDHRFKGTGRGYTQCTVCGMRGGEEFTFRQEYDPKPQYPTLPTVPPIWP